MKTSKLRVSGRCVVNSPVTGEFPAQGASNAENVSIWWCHHEKYHRMEYLLLNNRQVILFEQNTEQWGHANFQSCWMGKIRKDQTQLFHHM